MRVSRRQYATVLVAALVAAAFLLVELVISGGLPTPGSKYEVRAVVPTAMSLSSGSSVRIAGLQVGKVDKVERQGLGTVVTMWVDEDQAPIPADSTVAIKLRSLIGESYVGILPGRSRKMLADGGTVPMDQTTQYVEVEQILNELKGKTRTRARQLFRGFGAGLAGRGDELNEVVGGVAGAVNSAAPVAAIFDANRGRAARLIDQFGAMSRTIDQKGAEIRELARGASATFGSIGRRDSEMAELLSELPSTLRQVKSTSTVLRSVTGRSAPVISRLASALQDLGPAVELLRPASREGRGVFSRLSAAQPGLMRTLAQLRRLSKPASTALPSVRRFLCEANPLLRYLSPYASELAHFFQNTGSGTNYYDATGHAARLSVLVGEDSFGGVDRNTNQLLKTLTETGLAKEIHQVGYNPFPAPGKAGETIVGRDITGPNDAKGVQYPRVTADC